MQEVEEAKATCQLLQKDREQLIDHNAALAERVEQLGGSLGRSKEALQAARQEAAELQQVRGCGRRWRAQWPWRWQGVCVCMCAGRRLWWRAGGWAGGRSMRRACTMCCAAGGLLSGFP